MAKRKGGNIRKKAQGALDKLIPMVHLVKRVHGAVSVVKEALGKHRKNKKGGMILKHRRAPSLRIGGKVIRGGNIRLRRRAKYGKKLFNKK